MNKKTQEELDERLEMLLSAVPSKMQRMLIAGLLRMFETHPSKPGYKRTDITYFESKLRDNAK